MEEERLCRCVAEMTGANGDKQAEPVMNRILLQFHRFIDDARKSPQNLQTLYNTLQAPMVCREVLFLFSLQWR